jgi:hypothetical protein
MHGETLSTLWGVCPTGDFYNPTSDPARPGERGQRPKGGENLERARSWARLGFCCPVTPKNSGPQGWIRQLRASVITSGLECTRSRPGGTRHTPNCQSISRHSAVPARLQIQHDFTISTRLRRINRQPLSALVSSNAFVRDPHAGSQSFWLSLSAKAVWSCPGSERGCTRSCQPRCPGESRAFRHCGKELQEICSYFWL